jgi:hypothetical protein
MPTRRMEGEIVRDNLLWVADRLDATMGGPDIPNDQAQTSKRRSIYLTHAHERLVEFVQIFDGPKVSECYSREESIQPHQALAMHNSPLTNNAAADDHAFFDQRIAAYYVFELFKQFVDTELCQVTELADIDAYNRNVCLAKIPRCRKYRAVASEDYREVSLL